MTTMSREDFLIRSGVEGGVLETWLEARWIAARGEAFCEADVARAELIGQLKDDFGVNDEGIDVILHLIDQMHGLRRALRELRAAQGRPAARASP